MLGNDYLRRHSWVKTSRLESDLTLPLCTLTVLLSFFCVLDSLSARAEPLDHPVYRHSQRGSVLTYATFGDTQQSRDWLLICMKIGVTNLQHFKSSRRNHRCSRKCGLDLLQTHVVTLLMYDLLPAVWKSRSCSVIEFIYLSFYNKGLQNEILSLFVITRDFWMPHFTQGSLGNRLQASSLACHPHYHVKMLQHPATY